MPTEPTIQVESSDGVAIAVWSSGSGDPLLLVHGTTADHTRWDGVLGELGERFTVYTMDRRGRGRSGDSGRYLLEAEFDDVAAVVGAIGTDVNVLGHSYGALCALEAARRTSALTGLILYEPPLGGANSPPEEWLADAQTKIDAGQREAVLLSFMTDIVGVPTDQLAALRELPVWQARLAAVHTIPREFRAAVAYQFNPDEWSDLKIPVLLLSGSDTTWAPEPMSRLERALHNTRVAVMPGQQHVAMDTAKPVFLEAVFNFFGAGRP